MSRRRQEARQAEQEQQRQARRKAGIEQRRPPTGPATAGTRPSRAAASAQPKHRGPVLPIVAGVAGGILVLALAAFIIYDRIQPLPGVGLPTNGNEHVTAGQSHGAYFSNPPTSGWHFAELPRPGIYNQPIAPEGLGHFMEHAGGWVLYSCPEGCDDLVPQLKRVVERQLDRRRPAALAPYPPQGYPPPEHRINVITWQRMLSLDEFDEAKINDFLDRLICHYNPEGGPWCPGKSGSTEPAKDAGPQGFNAVTPATGTSPSPAVPTATPSAPAPVATPAVAGPTAPAATTGTPAP